MAPPPVAAWTVAQTTVDPVPYSLPELEAVLLRTVGFFAGFAVVVVVGWVGVEPVVSRIIRRRNRNNPTLEEAITRYVRLLSLVVATFVGLAVAGFSDVVGNSALVIAAATLGLGIAGQHVIGSLVSGTALVVDPNFNVGNYVKWDGGEGEVTSITLRVTRVRTPDGGLATVPNTELTDSTVFRPFEGDDFRVVERVPIPHGVDLDTALTMLEAATRDVDGVRADPAPVVRVDELGDDAVVLRVEYWVGDPRRTDVPVRSAVARRIKERFKRADIDVGSASTHDLDGRLRVTDGA